jgi:hypothetical protein
LLTFSVDDDRFVDGQTCSSWNIVEYFTDGNLLENDYFHW